MCRRGDGNVPAGYLAQRAGPGGFEPQLGQQAGQQRHADPAALAPLGPDHLHAGHRNPGMHQPRQPAVAGQCGLQQQPQVGERPGQRPGQGGAPATSCHHAQRRHQQAAADIGHQVLAAEVHPGGADAAPGLRQRPLGLPAQRVGVATQCGQDQRTAHRHSAQQQPAQAVPQPAGPPAVAAWVQPKTACHSASTAARSAARPSGSNWVGRSSNRAVCWARRSSR